MDTLKSMLRSSLDTTDAIHRQAASHAVTVARNYEWLNDGNVSASDIVAHLREHCENIKFPSAEFKSSFESIVKTLERECQYDRDYDF